jgi:hypothetical protein
MMHLLGWIPKKYHEEVETPIPTTLANQSPIAISNDPTLKENRADCVR